ncbi:MAG: RnfABCDGE type electron transport complex subunit B [Candidatus Omnitrophica bacterium]|nr:RnfABCDGE type electron transport complex subunit B [Candidatus Omnitrophota bacterium]MCF7878050.1 RnfABCDGE type electron transport complex subunit B [Candidatus Omnitrophota bacterium]
MAQVIAATIVFGLIGLAFSLLLSFLNRKLKVPDDPRVKEILNILPGLNCGACGFSSCKAYAQAIVEDPSKMKGCRPGGDQVNKKVAKAIGKKENLKKQKKMLVVCSCGAEEKDKKTTHNYQGLKNCQSAHITGGAIDCVYGCLGFGDCQEACPVGAITLKNNKVYIDQKKCILCGKCIKACSRNLFKIIPAKELGNYFIACNNKDQLKEVKDVCNRGCITCGICTKVEDSPYELVDNLSRINYKNIKNKKSLEEGKNKCPTNCIDIIN